MVIVGLFRVLNRQFYHGAWSAIRVANYELQLLFMVIQSHPNGITFLVTFALQDMIVCSFGTGVCGPVRAEHEASVAEFIVFG